MRHQCGSHRARHRSGGRSPAMDQLSNAAARLAFVTAIASSTSIWSPPWFRIPCYSESVGT